MMHFPSISGNETKYIKLFIMNMDTNKSNSDINSILVENDFEEPFILHIEKKLSRTCFANQALSTTT